LSPSIATIIRKEIDMKELIGKQIEKIFINDAKNILVFETYDNERLAFCAAGKCCNTVWFNNINGIRSIRGFEGERVFNILSRGLVLDVEHKGWTKLDDGDYEVLESCVVTIRTNKGYIDLEVRNSHNGYYGGNIENYNENGTEKLKVVDEDF